MIQEYLKLIFVLLISFGLISRGITYCFVSSKSPKSIFSKLSYNFAKDKDKDTYKEYNRIASKAYIFIGTVVFVFFIVLSVCYKDFVIKNYIFLCLAILVMDFLTNVLVTVKIKISNWDKTHQK